MLLWIHHWFQDTFECAIQDLQLVFMNYLGLVRASCILWNLQCLRKSPRISRVGKFRFLHLRQYLNSHYFQDGFIISITTIVYVKYNTHSIDHMTLL